MMMIYDNFPTPIQIEASGTATFDRDLVAWFNPPLHPLNPQLSTLDPARFDGDVDSESSGMLRPPPGTLQ